MIEVQSPTRVDLSGGTIDCWPLFLLLEGCVTVNLAIDIYTGVALQEISSEEIKFDISDLNYKKSFKNWKEASSSVDKEISLVQGVIKYFKPKKGFHLKTYSQSPIGGGLGGSSSLTISLIKAFSQWQNLKLSTSETVNLAHNIEAQILKKPTGTQDYIPAIESGLNIITYGVQGFDIETLNVPLENFHDHMVLVYTGQPHHSGINNWDVIKSAIDGDSKILSALNRVARVSRDMAQSCRSQDWTQLEDLFKREYEARIQLSPKFLCPEIEQLNQKINQQKLGALKICGAGGGGCVFVWTHDKEKVTHLCQKNQFQVLDVKVVQKKH